MQLMNKHFHLIDVKRLQCIYFLKEILTDVT